MKELIEEYLDFIIVMCFGSTILTIITTIYFNINSPMANFIKAYIESLIE